MCQLPNQYKNYIIFCDVHSRAAMEQRQLTTLAQMSNSQKLIGARAYSNICLNKHIDFS